MYGCNYSARDPGAAFRSFFYLKDFAMKHNDVLHSSRVSWKMASLNPVQIMPFNETHGVWSYDQIN